MNITEKKRIIEELSSENIELKEQNKLLLEKINEIETRLKVYSGNISKPPSSDAIEEKNRHFQNLISLIRPKQLRIYNDYREKNSSILYTRL